MVIFARPLTNLMKTLTLGLISVVCFILCGCATCQQAGGGNPPGLVEKIASDDSGDAPVKLLEITANVDGSGRMVFTSRDAHYEHKYWSPPTQVTFNGHPWNELAHSPAGWRRFSKGLDLSRAWIVKRQGRDVIALESTPAGFDLYLCDSPNGSADYAVTIAIPRRH